MTAINSLTENDFAEVLSIANDAFGDDYICKSTLFEYLSNDKGIGLVSRVNGTIVGFSLSRICELHELSSLVLSASEWFDEQFAENTPVGVINSIAVHPNYQKKGVGSGLIEKSVEKLSRVSKNLLSVCWEHNNTVNLASILNRFGFDPIHKIEQYWYNDSILKDYSCKFCGRPPCRCNAVLYVKKVTNFY